MPRTHLPYPPEFRHQMVELVRSGRAIRELAREFECSDQTIRTRRRPPTRRWIRPTSPRRPVSSRCSSSAGSNGESPGRVTLHPSEDGVSTDRPAGNLLPLGQMTA